jgi:hypothetical protein
MNLTNATKYPAAYTMGMDPSGQEYLVVVVKGTFSIPVGGEQPTRALRQVALVEADVFAGEPGFSAPVAESDFALRKPKCDVLLNGSACAPGGKPAEQVPVMLQVGSLSKSFNVVGHRAWVNDPFGWKPTRPVPFVKMPISYGNAFGGRDLTDPDEKNHRWYGSNHAGVGFHTNLYPPLVEGKPLPNTEEVGKPVEKPDGKYRPMSFGPLGRAWEPRPRFAGTYDKNWLDNVCPILPTDIKDPYYQCAPPDQQIEHPKGGEQVILVNLTPEGRTAFPLPPLELPVSFFFRKGKETEQSAVVDTLTLEPDSRRFTVVWRTSLALKKDVFEVADIFVGPMSKGWHKARRLGKIYCSSIAAALKLPGPLVRERDEP